MRAIVLLTAFTLFAGLAPDMRAADPANPATPPNPADVGAATPPAPRKPDTRPAAQRRVEWWLGTTLVPYNKIGKQNPKWDGPARAALRAAGRSWGEHPRTAGDAELLLYEATTAAVRAKCDDPMVLYAAARSKAHWEGKDAAAANLYRRAADGFRRSEYPPIRRAQGILRSAPHLMKPSPAKPNPADAADDDVAPADADVAKANVVADGVDEPGRRKARAAIDEALALFPEVFTNREIPTQVVTALLKSAGDVSAAVEGDRKVVGDRVREIIRKSPLRQGAKLAALGMASHTDAISARGGGFAHTVTDDGWRVYRAGLAEARRQIEEAWRLDPVAAGPEAAVTMIHVELGEGTGRAAMETWFQRAVEADPTEFRPYEAKLNWLEPKWHGSVDEMLAFGRECAAGGNWAALAPLMLPEAHWSAARYAGPNGYSREPRPEYFRGNAEAWDEIKAVYDRYLKEPDASRYHRTRYAVIAVYAGRWKEADALFKSFPRAKWHPSVLHDNKKLEAMAAEAADKAAKNVAPPPPEGL